MQWKCTFGSFPFSSCSDKEFAELFDFGNSNLFYSAKNLNDLFKNISTYNEHSIANQDSCNGNEINFFQNVDDQYLSSKDANSLLFNTSNENSNFSVLCLNIRSLSNLKNFSKLEGLLSFLTLAPSLIAVTKTWLKPNYSESIVNLPGYSFISNPRIKTQGGGVGFYVKDNLIYSTRLDLNRMEEKIFESLFIDVKFKNKTITFGCIYRAPCNDIVSNSSFLDILNNTLKRIKKRDCFLLGDFNYNILDCEKPQISDFVDQMFSNGFAPLINKPTRIS